MHTPARSGAHRRDEVQEAAPDHLGKVGVRGGACAGPGAGCGMGGPAKRCRRGVWQAGRQARTLLSFLACRRRRRIRLERRQEGAQHGAVGWLCQARPLQQLASAVQRQGAHPARQVEAVEGASWGGEEPCVTTSGAASLVSRVAAWPGSHAAGVPAQRRQRPRVPGGGGHGRQRGGGAGLVQRRHARRRRLPQAAAAAAARRRLGGPSSGHQLPEVGPVLLLQRRLPQLLVNDVAGGVQVAPHSWQHRRQRAQQLLRAQLPDVCSGKVPGGRVNASRGSGSGCNSAARVPFSAQPPARPGPGEGDEQALTGRQLLLLGGPAGEAGAPGGRQRGFQLAAQPGRRQAEAEEEPDAEYKTSLGSQADPACPWTTRPQAVPACLDRSSPHLCTSASR